MSKIKVHFWQSARTEGKLTRWFMFGPLRSKTSTVGYLVQIGPLEVGVSKEEWWN